MALMAEAIVLLKQRRESSRLCCEAILFDFNNCFTMQPPEYGNQGLRQPKVQCGSRRPTESCSVYTGWNIDGMS
eukprot:6077857-Pleurochrysis_carterae.AAC.2